MTQRRLVIWLVVFFLALAIPSSVLVYQAYAQLKWEAFHQHRGEEHGLVVQGELARRSP